jgi:intracellular sulfur oxidation DsrE/DsrF family protein
MENHKVLFHIDESEKWLLLLSNISNLLAAAENVSVEAVANSAAVRFYIAEHPLMDDLAASGVVFCACANALRGAEISADALPSYVRVVPAGVLEIMEQQEAGYCYIKP